MRTRFQFANTFSMRTRFQCEHVAFPVVLSFSAGFSTSFRQISHAKRGFRGVESSEFVAESRVQIRLLLLGEEVGVVAPLFRRRQVQTRLRRHRKTSRRRRLASVNFHLSQTRTLSGFGGGCGWRVVWMEGGEGWWFFEREWRVVDGGGRGKGERVNELNNPWIEKSKEQCVISSLTHLVLVSF